MSEQQKSQGGGQQGGRRWYKRVKPEAPKKPKGNYAFIDSQNLNLGVQKIGWKMDWHKFREWLRDEYGVTQAFMFIGYMPDNESLYQQMYDHGFLVVLKPTLEINIVSPEAMAAEIEAHRSTHDDDKQDKPDKSDKTEKAEKPDKPAVKGNIDADLVLYAMKEIPNYDKAVIVSGDGDFFGLIEYLIEQKKLLKLLAPNKRFSTLLKGFDEYIEGLDAHRGELAYRDRRGYKRSPKTS